MEMAKDLVNNLYKFLKEDVKEESLLEADSKIGKPITDVFAIEGRVPTDPSSDPEGYMGDLKEKEKESKSETPPAEETEDNKDTKVEKELDKETPELDKDPALQKQAEQGKGKKGEEQIKAAGVADVEVVKENKADLQAKFDRAKKDLHKAAEEGNRDAQEDAQYRMDKYSRELKELGEGRVPADPSSDNPENKGDLKEDAAEKELTVVSDENTAKEIAAKYQGGRVIPDPVNKKFIVKVPESTVVEDVDEKEDQQDVPKTDVKQGARVDDVQPDSQPEESGDADTQAGSPEAGADDGQQVPQTDVQQDAKVDDVAPSGVPDMTPDATSKAGSPAQGAADGQQVPKDTAEKGVDLPGVDTITVKEDAKSQAGAVPAKSVDDQAVPKTEVSLDNKTDDVKTASVADKELKPDAKKKVGNPKQSPKQGQVVPKTDAQQGAKIDNVGKAPAVAQEAVEEDVVVSVATDDKEITVADVGGQTAVSTVDKDAIEPPVEEPTPEPAIEEIPTEEEEEVIMSDEEATEMAEKLFLAGHLKEKPKLTKAEKEFVAKVESLQLSVENKKLVEAKLAKM